MVGKPYAVIDGHSAHLTKQSVKMFEAYFTVLRIPPRSCQFNSAERMFAYFKRNLGKVLASERPTSQQHFEQLVVKACNVVTRDQIPGIVQANLYHIADYVGRSYRSYN